MIRSALTKFSFALLLALLPVAVAQQTPAQTPAQTAEEESVRREENAILLRKVLKDAREDQKKGDLGSAAKLYEEAWALVQRIGDAGIEKERKEASAGFCAVYYELAKKSVTRAQYGDAKTQLNRILKVEPKHAAAQKMMADVEKTLAEQEGRRPSKETLAMLPEVDKARVTTATMVQDGKLLFEMGKLEEAEAKLHAAAKLDPNNQGAFYYLRLIEEARYAQEARKRELMAKNKMVEVENAWNPPVMRNKLPTANPFARTNTVHTGPGRSRIYAKLDRIRLDRFGSPGVGLSEIVKLLDEEVRLRDPEKRGLNFIISQYIDINTVAPGATTIDPVTNQPIAPQPTEQFEMASVNIRLDPELRDVRLADVLDAIVKVADKQIKYSIEEYAVVFSRKVVEQEQLFTRTFKVNPNTFIQGLESVVGRQFEGQNLGGNSTGTGGTSGGTTGGQGGQNGGNSAVGFQIPFVDSAGSALNSGGGGGGFGGGGGGGGGQRGGGGGGGQRGGGGGIGGGGQGQGGGGGILGVGGYNDYKITGVTAIYETSFANDLVRAYFSAAGVNFPLINTGLGQGGTGGPGGAGGLGGLNAGGLQPGQNKALFFNDRTGLLLVRATLEDLDIIDAAIQVLNQTPDQVTIQVKFVEIGQDDSKALGFDWFLGNTSLLGGKIGAAGGTQPSFQGPTSTENPYGTFPGTFGTPSALADTSTDQKLTSGLRGTEIGGTGIPTVGTITGILTDPQFRVAIHALEQRGGVDILSCPSVTTVSGRQASIQVTDLQTIITFNQVGAAGGGTTGTAAGTTTTTTGR